MSQLDNTFAQNGAKLTMDLFQELANANGFKENFVFSPLSIQCCLALAYAGSTGGTAQELIKGLKFVSNVQEEVALSFHNVLQKYHKSDLLKIGNKIYVQEGHSLKAEYKRTVTENYHSEAENVDFSQTVATAKKINDWISARTAGKITELISADCLDSMTRLVLLNAIHFKGMWAKQFDDEHTSEDDFYLNDKNTVKVNYMNLKSKFNYGYFDDLKCSALEMPYKDSDLSMLVLLPDEITGLKNLSEKLKEADLINLAQNMSVEEIVVKFPKFKTDFEIDLRQVLENMGIKKIFGKEAEFGNMLETTADLYASHIKHKATIEVNEEGTEAAAATGMVMMMRCMMMTTEFVADHPFLYVIWNKKNILFAGAFVNTPQS